MSKDIHYSMGSQVGTQKLNFLSIYDYQHLFVGRILCLNDFRSFFRLLALPKNPHKITVICFLVLKQPSECNTYADIDAAYKCLKEQYGVKDEQLILYGQSVGSGPTLDLASRISNLRGVVLHSPILSGLRVLYPVKRTYWFDIFKVVSYCWFYTHACFIW